MQPVGPPQHGSGDRSRSGLSLPAQLLEAGNRHRSHLDQSRVFGERVGVGHPGKVVGQQSHEPRVGAVVISADRLNLTMIAKHGANQVRCTVVSEEFIGAIVTLLVETENTTELKIQKQQREVEKIDIGADTPLWVSWLPEDVYILPAA